MSRPHDRPARPDGPEDTLCDRSVDVTNAPNRATQLLEPEFGERAKFIGVLGRP